MTGLNADSRRLLETVFGPTMDGAWLVTGQYAVGADGKEGLVPKSGGFASTAVLPDDRDIYFSVGAIRAGANRDEAGVDRVMVLMVDDVGKEIDRWAFDAMFPLKPTFIVESSKGSFQYGFAIEGGMSPDDYRALRRAMKASAVWGKAHNTGAVALYRLPQGTHTKASRGGWKARLELWDGKTFQEADLWKEFTHGAPPVAAVGGGAPDPVESPDLLEKLVEMIPNPVEDWDFFVNVGRAIWGASSGLAYEIFERWADKCPTANLNTTQGRWDSYHDASIGRRWLLREAEAAGGDVEGWLREEAADVFDDVDDMGLLGVGAPVEVEALQLSVAEDIVRRHGDRLRYNVGSGAWHKFDGSIWVKSPFKIGYQLAMAWAKAALPQLAKGPRAAVSKNSFFEGVEKMLQAHPAVAVTDGVFDQDDWLLGTPGGTVELRGGKLRPAVASEMISLSCSVAPADQEDCPRWKAFIDWMCSVGAGKQRKVDDGLVRFMRQWAGYCLTGDVSKEMLVFMHGLGANGKGTFIETMQAVMGSYFYMATRDLFMDTKFGPHTEELAALARVRMVAADEVPVTSSWNESLLKGVSGGGTMTGRHLYGKTFTFRIRFKLTISGNDKPAFQGRINEALKRRLHMAEFLQEAKPKREELKAELRLEAAGILRWALNGLQDMLSSPGGKLFVPDSVLTATEDYFNESDIFGAWLKLRKTEEVGAEAPASDVFANWLEYRNREGNHTLYGRESVFKAEMEKNGMVWAKTRKCNVYKGIKIEVF